MTVELHTKTSFKYLKISKTNSRPISVYIYVDGKMKISLFSGMQHLYIPAGYGQLNANVKTDN